MTDIGRFYDQQRKRNSLRIRVQFAGLKIIHSAKPQSDPPESPVEPESSKPRRLQ